MTAIVPIVVLIVGLLAWVLSSNPKVAEAGRILFWVGCFFTVAALSRVTLHVP